MYSKCLPTAKIPVDQPIKGGNAAFPHPPFTSNEKAPLDFRTTGLIDMSPFRRSSIGLLEEPT